MAGESRSDEWSVGRKRCGGTGHSARATHAPSLVIHTHSPSVNLAPGGGVAAAAPKLATSDEAVSDLTSKASNSYCLRPRCSALRVERSSDGRGGRRGDARCWLLSRGDTQPPPAATHTPHVPHVQSAGG
jgi:hypothetical protein